MILRQNALFVCAVGPTRNSSSRLKDGVGSDWILLAEPSFNLFPLGGQHDTLPFHSARLLAVLGHDVQTLIENLN
jgi:hypothetical protein